MNLLRSVKRRIYNSLVEAGGGGGGGSLNITPQNLKQFIVKALGFASSAESGRADFETPEFDLSVIKSAKETDSYIAQALSKNKQLMLKAGYYYRSNNDAAVEYLSTRLRIMAFCTGIPTDVLWQEVLDDLNDYSNAYLVKSRVDKIQGGVQAKGILNKKPIGGYFRLDPSTVEIKRDASGNVQQYKQKVGNEEKTFPAVDMVHFYIDRPAGGAYGFPRIQPALEDVKLLRKLEGMVVGMVYRFAVPVYHWMIGLPELGQGASDQEIKDAKKEIEKMAMDGVVITSERTNIKVIGAEGEAIDAKDYLAYMEKRVFSGLGTSESQMGRGGAKQDADSMEAQQHSAVKYIQRTFATFVKDGMFTELLMEGGYQPLTNPDDSVEFVCNEINLETQIKLQNHEMSKFQGNVQTFEEMRKNVGDDKKVVDEGRLYANMVVQKNALELVNAKNQGGGTGTPGPAKEANKSSQNSTKSKNNPTNQNGSRGGPKIKESAESMENDQKLTKNVQDYQDSYASAHKKWCMARNDIIERNEDPQIVLPILKDALVKEFRFKIAQTVGKAREDLGKKLGRQYAFSSKRIFLSELESKIERSAVKTLKDLLGKIKDCETKEEKATIMDAMAYRIRFMAVFAEEKAYWYSFAKYCQEAKIEKIRVKFSRKEEKEGREEFIHTSKITMDSIPPFHPYCECELEPVKPEGKAA